MTLGASGWNLTWRHTDGGVLSSQTAHLGCHEGVLALMCYPYWSLWFTWWPD